MTEARIGPASQPEACGVCQLHQDPAAVARFEICRTRLWLLRHHPLPAPLPGWLLLDARRHLGGAADFRTEEAADFGPMLQRCTALVRQLSGCERVYAIAFGEGARHLHVHLIPRHSSDPLSEAWSVADLYRQVVDGRRAAASEAAVDALVRRARPAAAGWG